MKNLPLTRSIFKKKIKKNIARGARLIAADPFRNYREKTVVSMPVSFSPANLHAYVQHQWASIRQVTDNSHLRNKDLHAIRKKIKDLFYNMKIYDEQEAGLFLHGNEKGIDTGYFDSLLNDLGTFQDDCTAINLLKKHLQDKMTRCNRKALERIKRKWEAEKEMLGTSLINKIKTDLAF